jgi:lipopolysaccharide export system permease protein
MRLARPGCVPYYPQLMRRLDRYILRQCFGVMLFVTAALSAAIWLAQSLRLIDLIVNRGLSIDIFLPGIAYPTAFSTSCCRSAPSLPCFHLQPADVQRTRRVIGGLSHGTGPTCLVLAGIASMLIACRLTFSQHRTAYQGSPVEIRNRFVSACSRRTFTDCRQARSISVIDDRGEVTGLLISRYRDPAAGYDPRRARPLRRNACRITHCYGQRQPPAIRHRGPQAFAADFRALHP